MTISTASGKPFSILFMLFNFLMYWILKFVLLDEMAKNHSTVFTSTIMLIFALITCLIYILINMYFTNKKIIRRSNYIGEYGCSIFTEYNMVGAVKIKKDICNIYINHMYLCWNQYPSDRAEYISKLKSRFLRLSKSDILYVYFYKYINTVLMSILLFSIWQISNSCIASTSISRQIIIASIISIALISVYFIVDIICMNVIIKTIKKRNLEFFISK